MAIDIKELVIRARIDPKGEDKKPASGSGSAKGAQMKQEIVAECVEQVLEILRQKQER